MYNKGTLKNGHLKKIQMAHHRLSPVTRNMYEVISEIYRIVKKTLHMVRRKQRSVVQVHERRRFRWRQLKNIFIMMVTQNWEVVSTRDAFKINLESVHMQMLYIAWLKCQDAGIWYQIWSIVIVQNTRYEWCFKGIRSYHIPQDQCL